MKGSPREVGCGQLGKSKREGMANFLSGQVGESTGSDHLSGGGRAIRYRMQGSGGWVI